MARKKIDAERRTWLAAIAIIKTNLAHVRRQLASIDELRMQRPRSRETGSLSALVGSLRTQRQAMEAILDDVCIAASMWEEAEEWYSSAWPRHAGRSSGGE